MCEIQNRRSVPCRVIPLHEEAVHNCFHKNAHPTKIKVRPREILNQIDEIHNICPRSARRRVPPASLVSPAPIPVPMNSMEKMQVVCGSLKALMWKIRCPPCLSQLRRNVRVTLSEEMLRTHRRPRTTTSRSPLPFTVALLSS